MNTVTVSTEELLRSVEVRRQEPHREVRGHDFFPPAAELAMVPQLDATEHLPRAQKPVMLHYFADGSDWWICELDPVTGRAFGYVCHADLDEAEWAFIGLNELCSLLIPTTPSVIVQRDLTWRPAPVHCCDLPGRRAS